MSEAHAAAFWLAVWWAFWVGLFILDPNYATTTTEGVVFGTVIAGGFVVLFVVGEVINEVLRVV